jgi:hypothetical protein
MLNSKFSIQHKTTRAQAMVEFAIVLPILMLLLVGIFEAARMVFTYGAVTTAAREASRYASAVGYNNDGSALKYNDCAGIIETIGKTVFFSTVEVELSYDRGPGDTPLIYCRGRVSSGAVTVDSAITITLSSKDRVNSHVWANYSPMIRLIPFPTRKFEATSSRTILGIFQLAIGTGTSTPMGGGPTGTATTTKFVTATPNGTATATSTGTRTSTPGAFSTLTPQESPTITLIPADTLSPTASQTPTITLTPTDTPTPTSTSTPVPGCGDLSASGLIMAPNSSVIRLTITNPHDTITLASLQVIWNHTTGGSGSKPLTWLTATVAGQSWSVNDTSGNYLSTPGTAVTIPGNNTSSTLIIVFDKNYQNPVPNGTTVTLNFSTIGCSSITRTQ